MGLDAEEGFAESDEGGNMENRVWGKMVKIEPIEEHEAPEKGVERETQTSDEVGDEDHPLPFSRSGNGGGRADLVRAHGRSAFGRRYPSAWSSAMVPAVAVEGIHCPLLLAALDADAAAPFPLPAIFHGGGRGWGENGAWSRSRGAGACESSRRWSKE